MRKRIQPFGLGFIIYYLLITFTLVGMLVSVLIRPINILNLILLPIAFWIFLVEVKDTYLLLEADQITLSRRFRANNKVRIRKETLQLLDVEQVAYGSEIKKARREQSYSGRHSGYTPKEILFKVGNKYIPIDAGAYSKRNLRMLMNHLNAIGTIEIFGSLQNFVS